MNASGKEFGTLTEVQQLPLEGVRVVEMARMVMGPTCGMILGDLGAEVIKVEPVTGDGTRRLLGTGAGFFGSYNRNKKSIAVNFDDPRGVDIILRLVASADVFGEGFNPEAMKRLGLCQETLSRINPGLIHVSYRGFLPGPLEDRMGLDEATQMMAGLAWMTGPEGQPLAAGANVNDVMSGMFAAIGVMAALARRERTGHGEVVQTGVFESCAFLMMQHMMQYAITEQAPKPRPTHDSAWAVYDVFETRDGGQVFLAAVSDAQWNLMCDAFEFEDLRNDLRLRSNNARVRAHAWLMPALRERFARFTADELIECFESLNLPCARIGRPQDLFEDTQLLEGGTLAPVTLPEDASAAGHPVATQTVLLPLVMGGERLQVRCDPPALGQHTWGILQDLGYSREEINGLREAHVVKTATVHG